MAEIERQSSASWTEAEGCSLSILFSRAAVEG